MKKGMILLVLVVLVAVFMSFSANCASSRLNVLVIAPTSADYAEAKVVLRANRWTEAVSGRDADGILVVIKNSSYDPLAINYVSASKLQNDAFLWSSSYGDKFHIYFYQINADSGVFQTAHKSYRAASEPVISNNIPATRPGYAGYNDTTPPKKEKQKSGGFNVYYY